MMTKITGWFLAKLLVLYIWDISDNNSVIVELHFTTKVKWSDGESGTLHFVLGKNKVK